MMTSYTYDVVSVRIIYSMIRVMALIDVLDVMRYFHDSTNITA